MAQIPNPTYANTTITTATLSSGSGLTYNSGTTTWSDPTAGTVSAKDFVLDGVSLKSILEERLNMMVPNPELEKEWAELKELGNKYRKLEADLKEKSRMWQALKNTTK